LPLNWIAHATLLVVIILVGTWTAGIIEKRCGQRDPSFVVIDEVAGMWLALSGAQQVWWYFLGAFLIFRLFDVLKPGPISRLQELSGGWGIMLDDLGAGVAALVIIKGILILI